MNNDPTKKPNIIDRTKIALRLGVAAGALVVGGTVVHEAPASAQDAPSTTETTNHVEDGGNVVTNPTTETTNSVEPGDNLVINPNPTPDDEVEPGDNLVVNQPVHVAAQETTTTAAEETSTTSAPTTETTNSVEPGDNLVVNSEQPTTSAVLQEKELAHTGSDGLQQATEVGGVIVAAGALASAAAIAAKRRQA